MKIPILIQTKAAIFNMWLYIGATFFFVAKGVLTLLDKQYNQEGFYFALVLLVLLTYSLKQWVSEYNRAIDFYILENY